MKYGTVPGVDKPVARLVLGTMIINRQERERSFGLLDAAMGLGWSTLDSAHVYAGGESERAIGEWMRERGNRERVVLLTKGGVDNQDRPRVTPWDITADLQDSLARLKTSYVDIYLLHRDDPDVDVGPLVEILNEHKVAGRIRAFGGSNWRSGRIAEANEYAYKHGLIPFAASSPHFSLAVQVEPPWPGCLSLTGPREEASREWYRRTGLAVFAYSSLARGFFSGRITRDSTASVPDLLDEAARRAYYHECNLPRLDRAGRMAGDKGVSVPQIALAYVLNQTWNSFALVGAANAEELERNTRALDLTLSPEELCWLEKGA